MARPSLPVDVRGGFGQLEAHGLAVWDKISAQVSALFLIRHYYWNISNTLLSVHHGIVDSTWFVQG